VSERDSYSFDLDTKQKTWKHVCFYDFETAPVDVDWKDSTDWLDIRNIGICAYTFAIPAGLYKPVLPGTATVAGEYVYVQNYNEANREQITQEAREIVEWLAQQSKRKGKVLLIGYNSNRFDILLFVDMLRPEPYGCYRYGHTSLIFSDLLPWARSMGLHMLAQVGEFLQLPKLEHTKDYEEYNRRDVEILVQFWHWLQSQGITYLTSAGESRHRMAQDLGQNLCLKAIYTDKAISDLVEYYGGRTEAYVGKVKEAWDLDINSLYPSVMCNFQYPAIDPENGKIPMYKQPPTEGFVHAVKTQLNTALQELLEQPVITPELARNAYNKHCTFHGCLYVQLRRIKPEYRSIGKRLAFWFPFPHKQAGYTMFSFTKQPFWAEFYECLWLSFFDYDILDAVITPLWSAFPAADAVRARYNLKREAKEKGDTNTYLLQKIFLNSAYGIFGTKNRVWELVLEEPLRSTIIDCFYQQGLENPFVFGENGKTYKVHADKVFVQNNRPDQKYAQNTVPIWAIATTSHARFVLYSYMLNAVLRSELQIYYTDTDSLFVNQEFVEFLQANNCISSSEIGKFKIEGGPSDATFLAPKTYIFGGQRHFKGTGQDWVRTIVAQSPRQQFTVYNRYALDPSQPQKRLYVASSGLFLPVSRPAVSKDLPTLCQSVGFTLPSFSSEPEWEFELDL